MSLKEGGGPEIHHQPYQKLWLAIKHDSDFLSDVFFQ